MDVDGSDNVYVAGTTNSTFEGNTNAGGRDMFLVKYDSTGSKQWTRQLGSSGRELPCGVIADSSDNVYVTGTTNGAFEGNTNIGDFHMFLIKYNASGVKQL